MGGLAVRTLRESTDRAMIALKWGLVESTPEVLMVLAAHAKKDPANTNVPPLPEGWEKKLWQHGIITRRYGQLVLSKRGHKMALALAETVPVAMTSAVGNALQQWVRDARADLHMMTGFHPFFLDKFWWRSAIWSFKRWWAGTNPEARSVMDFSTLTPHVAWSEADEHRNGQMWVESRFKAFWLCPTGVEKGLQHLNALEKLKAIEGEGADEAAVAVAEIAKLCEGLQPVRTKLSSAPRAILAVDNATSNRVSYAATEPATPVDGDIWVDYNLKRLGNHYSMEPFIIVDPATNQVIAVPTAMERADEAVTRAVKLLAENQHKPNTSNENRPAVWTAMDEFDNIWKGMVLASEKPTSRKPGVK